MLYPLHEPANASVQDCTAAKATSWTVSMHICQLFMTEWNPKFQELDGKQQEVGFFGSSWPD